MDAVAAAEPRAAEAGAALRWRPLVLLLSGAAAGSCYWPNGSGWPMWAALAPLLWAVEEERPGRAFLWAWLWGLAGWGVAMHWFVRVTLEYAAGPWAWRLALACGVIAYHGLMLALPMAAARALAPRLEARGFSAPAALALCAAPCLVAAEGLFPQVYPACVAATQLGHLPAVQSLELWGPGGVSWLIMGVNGALYAAWRLPEARKAALAGAAAAVLLNEAWGLARVRQVDAGAAAAPKLAVAVLQGDLPLKSRNTGGSAETNIAFYRGLTAAALAAAPADLVLWPHNSYERVLRFADDDPGLERPALEPGPLAPVLAADLPFAAHVLVSAEARSAATTPDPWPSKHFVTVLKGPDGTPLGSTAKVNPTPLAEKMPFGDRLPFLYRITPKLKRLVPGPSRVLRMADGTPLGVFICYDGVKTGPARRLAAAGARVLLNPSSDQWSYDRTAQPWQHLRIVMMRAVENRRYFVRATPSGVSAVVDAAGRVVRELPVDGKGFFTERVALLDGRTPFMFLGDAAYWLALLLVLALAGESLTRGDCHR